MALARRLAGLVVALVLAASLPLAAARAGCACAHEHGAQAAAARHTCTAACTADTCPMHRAPAAHVGRHEAPVRDAFRCSCAGEAQALIGQVTVAGVLPSVVALAAPALAATPRTTVAEAPLSLAATPPAPPPRA